MISQAPEINAIVGNRNSLLHETDGRGRTFQIPLRLFRHDVSPMLIHVAPLGLRVDSTMFAIHISPRWGFDMCVFGISIHIALLWSAGIELIAVL